eukprot:CAMPEP_0181504056 /NCGR_PEP_ID=MMETSP1110-20121109/57287_1 /TAXON_ID=174948 /ORGANISM="Symbiodinium sp., Strain CCMP421" /LENGTH=121 /DNA_ID=CAMNT_0023632881 /DNA_START=326 /DNA_END=688 /DNA_ORIENTATION=-
MNDIHPMDLLNPGHDLVKEAACLSFFHPALGHDVVKQLPTGTILHDEIQLTWCLYDLVELNYVRMLHQFEDVNFPGNSFHISNIHNSLLLENLHRHLLARKNVGSELDLSESPLPDRLAED